MAAGLRVAVRKAFTVHPPEGPSIDFFPPEAEWHHGVQVQAPRPPPFGNGARNAIKKLKVKRDKELKRKTENPTEWCNIASYQIEELVKEVQETTGFNEQTDPSGEKRFSEAQRRISAGTWKTLLLTMHSQGCDRLDHVYTARFACFFLNIQGARLWGLALLFCGLGETSDAFGKPPPKLHGSLA